MARPEEILGYELLAVLGHGARSTIYAVKDKESHIFALKRVIKQSSADQRFLDQAILEHEIASRFAHPNLRQSFKIHRQRSFLRTSEIIVVMEMVDGVTLEQYKGRGVRTICEICRQVCVGLSEMHDGGYVHADIKPNNILVTDDRTVKVIDFGQSCPSGTVKERIQGTPDYIAPEQVLRKKITPKTDIFNLGATMYWLFTGRHIPTLIHRGKAGVDIKTDRSCPAPREVNPEITPALSSLVMNCIEPSPRERLDSMRVVQQRLELVIAQLDRDIPGKGGVIQPRSAF